MKYINRLFDIEKYVVTNENIYCSGNNTYIYNYTLKLLRKIPYKCFTIIKFNNYILFQFENGQSIFVIQGVDYLEMSSEKYYLFKNIISNESLFILRDDDLINQFDCNLREIKVHSIGRFPKMIFSNKTIRIPNHSIFCCDLDSNIQLWQHSFSELLNGNDIKQTGNIIVHEDKLYFYLYDNKGSNRATICIDVNTGNVLDTYNDFGGDLYLFGNKIGVAAYDIVQVLDLETRQIKEYDFSKIFEANDLKISWNGNIFTDEGLLYFLGTNKAKNKVGILDLNTEKLVWHTSLDIPETEYNVNQQVRSIQVHDNRLYVHCSDNTLHIFERFNEE